MAFKDPRFLAQELVNDSSSGGNPPPTPPVSPKLPRRSIRDLDDGQAWELPDVTPQEFIDGLKSGNIDYSKINVDSALLSNLGDAIMGEFNMSPREYGDIINNNYKLKGNKTRWEWNDRYLDEWDKWDKNGRPKTRDDDWNWDFYNNYAPNGYLRWYRPQDQWGSADKIHARDEWDWDYAGDKIHDNFNPYRVGYDSSRAAWQKFIDDYGTDIINPKYAKILEWLDKNKEYF